MNRENLQKMATFLSTTLPEYLKNAPKDSFDLHSWGRKTECGTACCAMGWAAELNLFEGLHTIKGEDEKGRETLLLKYFDEEGVLYHGWGAVAKIFGVSKVSYLPEYLFHLSYYTINKPVTPEEIAWRINKILSSNLQSLANQSSAEWSREYASLMEAQKS